MSKRHAGIRCRTAAGPAGRALASAAFCPPRRLRRPRSAISPRSPWLGAPKTRWPLYGARGCPPPQGDMRPSPPFQGGSGSHVRLSEPHSSNRRSAGTCLEKRAPLSPISKGGDSHVRLSKRHAGIRRRAAAGLARRALAPAASRLPERLQRPGSAISPRDRLLFRHYYSTAPLHRPRSGPDSRARGENGTALPFPPLVRVFSSPRISSL
jgi:hypothetical protein